MAWVAHDLGFLAGGTYSIALATTPDDDQLVIVGQGDTGSSGFASHGFWWTQPTGMVDLGILPGGTFSIATGVSTDGTKVTGQADDALGFPQPVLWVLDIAGNVLSMTALPLLGTGQQGVAYGVSYDGSTVVGFSDTDPFPTVNTNPFKWTSGGGTVDLGLLAGNAVGIGTCCSQDGTTIFGGTNNTTDLPWKWTSGGGVVAVPLAGGEANGAVLACAADASAATGWNTTIPGGNQHAFKWTPGGGSTLIGVLSGADFSVGNGMSTLGTYIVGDSSTSGNHQAFLWSQADGFVELLPLGGGDSAIAYGVAGITIGVDLTIVGRCRVSGVQHAVYWQFDTPPPTEEFISVADLWFSATAAFVDLTVESNRRNFISIDGGTQNLGTNGEKPFGTSPPVFLTRTAAPITFATNRGRGGPFGLSSGALTAGASNPPGTSTSSQTFTPPSPGKGVLGDYRNGNLYAFNPATLTDNGTSRRWLRRWRALAEASVVTVKFNWLNIMMETGAGMAPDANPQVVLRWSDDGGHSWSNERIVAVGRLGETSFTVKFNRLGSTRRFSGVNRIFELSSTDPFVVSILDAEVDTG